MKKKILIPMLCLIATLCLTFGFSACGETENKNSGSTQQTTSDNKKPSGSESEKPEEGDDSEKEPEEGGNDKEPEEDDEEHKEPEEEEPQEPSKSSGTAGLTYALSSDEASYVCTGMGTANASSVEVASWYQNKWVTGIKEKAFWGCTATAITVPDSVTSIGEKAFSESRFTNITLGKGVTSIAEDAFAECYYLISVSVNESNAAYASQDGILYNKAKTEFVHIPYNLGGTVTIPDGITTIGEKAFDNRRITGITILENVTKIEDYAFKSCRYLATITIPNSVTEVGEGAFYRCSVLKNVTLSNKLTEIGKDTFYECEKLESISFPQSVTKIGAYAFALCNSLTAVSIPDNVTKIGEGAFLSCDNLASISVHDGITEIGMNAFGYTAYSGDSGNWEDDSLYVGNHLIEVKDTVSGIYAIKEGTLTVASGALSYYDLTGIQIPASVRHIGDGAFRKYSMLESFVVDEDNTAYVSLDGILYDAARTRIVHVPTKISGSHSIPSGVTEIEDQAFYYCQALQSISIPVGVTKIGEEAFYNCTSITGIALPAGVTSIGAEAFSNCTRLVSITLPDSVTEIGVDAFGSTAYYEYSNNWEDGLLYIGKHLVKAKANDSSEYVIRADTLTIADKVFYNCRGIEGITVEDGNTRYHSAGNCLIETQSKTLIAGCKNSVIPADGSVARIEDYAFSYCSGLTGALTIPNSVTSIGKEAFYYCSALTSVTIGSGVKSIGDGAFSGCSSLESIVVDENNTVYASQDGILYNKAKTEFILIPKAISGSVTVPDSITHIGDKAFSSCNALTSITLPSSVTSIGYEAFSSCATLTSITIESRVTSIRYKAFSGCYELTSITFNGTMAQWNAISKDSNWDDYTGNYTVYCTDGNLTKTQ